MSVETFVFPVIASIVATLILGIATYKIIRKNKTVNKANQKGNNNSAIVGSIVKIKKN